MVLCGFLLLFAPNFSGPEADISSKARLLLISAALLALFLGALDALVVGAAMPSIVADLGGLPLYSWAFSVYLLARAIALPIFGKLCDLFSGRRLYIIAIVIFIASSALGGMARSMSELIVCRAIQGIGAGGTFALAYIVLSDLYPPERRGKMMGLISFIWGISSILGPPAGGFIVAFASWRWIFYMNLPLGCLALLGIVFYLKETREKKKHPSIDFLGAATLSISVTALLTAFLLAGRAYPWLSPQIGCLSAIFLASGIAFYFAEKRAGDPILALSFFWKRRFSLANGSAFFSSFAVFSLSAFAPLFIQGVLGRNPAQVGLAMIPLTLGWSVGAMVCGQLVSASNEKACSIAGSFLLAAGSGLALALSSPEMPPLLFSAFLAVSGVGMGFVSIPTLLIVQKSLAATDLGVATSSQQFARTLGGTIGIGVSGGLVTTKMMGALRGLADPSLHEPIPNSLAARLVSNVESLFQPEIQQTLPPLVRDSLQSAIGTSVEIVFWCALASALVSLALCCFLPVDEKDVCGAVVDRQAYD